MEGGNVSGQGFKIKPRVGSRYGDEAEWTRDRSEAQGVKPNLKRSKGRFHFYIKQFDPVCRGVSVPTSSRCILIPVRGDTQYTPAWYFGKFFFFFWVCLYLLCTVQRIFILEMNLSA